VGRVALLVGRLGRWLRLGLLTRIRLLLPRVGLPRVRLPRVRRSRVRLAGIPVAGLRMRVGLTGIRLPRVRLAGVGLSRIGLLRVRLSGVGGDPRSGRHRLLRQHLAQDRSGNHRQLRADRRVLPVRLHRELVVALELGDELRIAVRPAVDQRALLALEHGDHVLAGQRLVRLERVGQGQHPSALVLQYLLGLPEQPDQVGLDPLGQRAGRGLGALG
jgi:hypothetical protein